MQERYNHLNTYLKSKFGERTLKICIDGHFTCPNRDGKVGTGGCIFCSKRGAGDLINNVRSSNESDYSFISEQVTNYFKSYRSKRANKFIAYFQNFTNTYSAISNLKKKYDASLIDERIVGLDIATRPDCINKDVCNLLSSYQPKYSVTCELGLQTSNDDIAKIINRGYPTSTFCDAVKLLNSYNIEVVVHIMCGLPNETDQDLLDTVNCINFLPISGIKIHSCYILKDTVLNDMYQAGTYKSLKFDEYMEKLILILTHIRPDIIIHRLSAYAPKDLLVAPEWNVHKKWVLNGIKKELKERNLYQGIYYKPTI